MKIDWNVVPSDYRYLDNVVLQNRLNDLLVVSWVDELGRPAAIAERTSLGLATGLTETELADLSRVYREILQKEDNFALLKWHMETRGEEVENAASWILRLLTLLRELGEFGVDPFNQQLIVCEPRLTWENLPQELGYIRDAVERYCCDLPDDGPVAQAMYFLRKTWRRMFSGERRRLREVAKRIEEDRVAIKSWYQDVRKSPEAGEFLSLQNVLTSADVLRVGWDDD